MWMKEILTDEKLEYLAEQYLAYQGLCRKSKIKSRYKDFNHFCEINLKGVQGFRRRGFTGWDNDIYNIHYSL